MMNIFSIKKNQLLFSAVLMVQIFCFSLLAQDINKEVFVVRPYEPTLSDAKKYSFMPGSETIETTRPQFVYTVSPKRIEQGFEPELIKPARTVATSLPKIYKSWLKLGLGNYNTSLAEFNISNIRSKEYAFGAYLYHNASRGNIRLVNNDKVPAGYALHNINLYGKKLYSKANLSGNLRFDHSGFNYYGYNAQLFADSVPLHDRDSLKQNTYLAGFDLGLASTFTDSLHVNYRINASYDYFWDKLKNKENNFVIEASADKRFYELHGGVDISLDYSHLDADRDTLSNTIFSISPWISKGNSDWKFKLGLEAASDVADISNFYFFPHANLDIIIVEDVLVPFIGLSGGLKKNNYQTLSGENHFILPGLRLKNTINNIVIFGGLRGSISSAVRFRADVTYTIARDMYFFVNDTLLPLQNQFTAVYDDVDLITYHGQLAWQSGNDFEIMVNGNYFDYNMLEQIKPWHKPLYEVELDALYKLNSKFTLGTGLDIIGPRWIQDISQPEGMLKLKPVADVNLKVNYNFSKVFTLFADIYNLADRSYMIWNQYPSQRFNFLFGFTYKL
ncbi:MAG TPA: hypothetical protein VJ203_07555 [Bacteroidales bacterium]|nr:hypothetical protein [Bacteroidales bacterium]